MELSSKDIIKLADMMLHINRAQSPNRTGGTSDFIYYFPKDKKSADKAFLIFKKYNLPADMHMSSLNNRAFPIIRFPLTHTNISEIRTMALKLQAVQEARNSRSKRDGFASGRMAIIKRNIGTMWQNLQDWFTR